MERQLLLASNISGIRLSSSLTSGTQEGGTKLVIEAQHKVLSGGINFDNTQSKELGRQQGQARAVISSSLGLGETVSLFGLSRPTFKGMAGTGIEVPIRAGGFYFCPSWKQRFDSRNFVYGKHDKTGWRCIRSRFRS